LGHTKKTPPVTLRWCALCAVLLPRPAALRVLRGADVLLRVACAVCRVACAVCRVPCAVCRVPCAVCRVPCAVCHVPNIFFPVQMIKALLAAVLVIATTQAAYIQLNGVDVTTSTILNPIYGPFLSGWNLKGNVIQSGPGTDENDCQVYCANTPGCTHWVLYSGGSCFAKNGFIGAVATSGCSAGMYPHYTPYTFDLPRMIALCEATSGCTSFSTADGMLRSYSYNSSVISFISNTTCGTSGQARLEPGSCLSPNPEAETLIVCDSMAAASYFTVTAAFNLPPFLLEEACDKSAGCAGFMASADGTHGWLLGYAPVSGFGTVAVIASAFL
jgi:hypothetical protein